MFTKCVSYARSGYNYACQAASFGKEKAIELSMKVKAVASVLTPVAVRSDILSALITGAGQGLGFQANATGFDYVEENYGTLPAIIFSVGSLTAFCALCYYGRRRSPIWDDIRDGARSTAEGFLLSLTSKSMPSFYLTALLGTIAAYTYSKSDFNQFFRFMDKSQFWRRMFLHLSGNALIGNLGGTFILIFNNSIDNLMDTARRHVFLTKYRFMILSDYGNKVLIRDDRGRFRVNPPQALISYKQVCRLDVEYALRSSLQEVTRLRENLKGTLMECERALDESFNLRKKRRGQELPLVLIKHIFSFIPEQRHLAVVKEV